MGLVQHLRVLDVGRAQRRRLRVRGQPVRARADELAGADRADRRHRPRERAVQPDRAAEPADRRAVSGRMPRDVRRARRERAGRDPRADRDRVVRHPDLSCVERARDRRAEILPAMAAVCGRPSLRLPRAVGGRLGRLHAVVGAPGVRVLERDGDDQEVHRLRGPGRLRRDVHPRRLHGVARGLAQHRHQPRRRQVSRRGSDSGDDHRRVARRVVLLRADAELRRFLALLPLVRRSEARQFLGGCRSTSSRSRWSR